MQKEIHKIILFAEDDNFFLNIISNRLMQEGYKVDMVSTGRQVLNKIKKNQYNLILLDLIMPGMDGFEVLKKMKELKINTPILVLSNLGQKEDIDEVLALGVKEYFVKSIHAVDDVIEKIKYYTKESYIKAV